ncbi:MAG: hypothetical protein RBU37_16680, partial [Myxococcota bacterium]|nr:hypothetical protein [Myxococcota bacterium]
GVVSLFGFYPEADVDGQGYTFTLPNKTGLAANSAVDFYLLGGLDCHAEDGSLLEEGSWHIFGQGQVDASGQSIIPNDGLRLPCMTWLGVAPSP